MLIYGLIFATSFIGMQVVAWLTHKYVMHGVLWPIHRDHHQKDPERFFETNDLFFLFFAIPGIVLLYLGINLATISIPLIFTLHPKIKFHTQWPALGKTLLTSGIFMLAWDVLYTKLGVWGFDDRYVSGFYLLGLPVEEWLFFLCMPYACLFSWFCPDKLGSDFFY